MNDGVKRNRMKKNSFFVKILILFFLIIFLSGPSAPLSAETAKPGFAAIAAASFITEAIKADGSMSAWGNNYQNRTDVPQAALSGVVAISAGLAHTLALKDDGSVNAWGLNNFGQATPPEGLTGVVDAAAGG